jgi:serine/threonine-protein phosphatase 2B catalytic subunit
LNRSLEIPEQGALCDLLWSDPVDESHDNWVSNKMRSCSYYYSRNQAMRFLNANNLKLIIRGHEVQMRGYKYQQAPDSTPLTLTLFSAPKYCDSYKNKGAVAILNVTPHPRRARTSRSSPSRRWSTPSC